MRIGLFGGTFDPPHVGHLLAASDAHERLRLDRLIFIPAAQQPLKAGRPMATPEVRLRMLRAMLDGDARFDVDPAEIERSGLSFTVDTLTAYAERLPDAERFFLVGTDSLATFTSWREPARILSLARLVVLTRAEADGTVSTVDGIRARLRPLLGSGGLEPVVLATRRVDVSATEIRARVREGRPIHGFVVDAVARLIEAEGLYRQGQE